MWRTNGGRKGGSEYGVQQLMNKTWSFEFVGVTKPIDGWNAAAAADDNNDNDGGDDDDDDDDADDHDNDHY